MGGEGGKKERMQQRGVILDSLVSADERWWCGATKRERGVDGKEDKEGKERRERMKQQKAKNRSRANQPAI